MAAGDSAGTEARRALALVDADGAAALADRDRATRRPREQAPVGLAARRLAPLTRTGHHLLADRAWPGSPRSAQIAVELVVVGPAGVFVVETRAWRDVAVRDDRAWRGAVDVTEELDALAALGRVLEGELAEVGLAPGEVHPLVVLAGASGPQDPAGAVTLVGDREALRHVAAHGQRLTPAHVEAVLARALTFFPVLSAPGPVLVPAPAVVPGPATPADPLPAAGVPAPVDPPAPAHVPAPGLGDPTEQDVQQALRAGDLAKPVEEWMAFLHPAQARLVRRTFNGPARIRGGAGTGKTVVGLHRAAYLARQRPGTVLFATHAATLPMVMRQAMARLAPDVVDRIEFAGVHALAARVARAHQVQFSLDDERADAVLARAWNEVGARGPLGALRLPQRYWHDEIRKVIKGRGLARFEQYADLPRTGRRYPLTVELREAVWEVYRAYEDGLRAARIHDLEDVVLLAEAAVRAAGGTGGADGVGGRGVAGSPAAPAFSAVVVDEVQDLTCGMLRLLHALAGEGPDALTLIGDGQQALYPGGYTLAEAGVSVAGRGVVLDVNFRNTAQILEFASRVVDGDEYVDVEAGALARSAQPETVAPRSGPAPELARFTTAQFRDSALAARVRELLGHPDVRPADIGVLCLDGDGVRQAMQVLMYAAVPVIELENSRAEQGGAVRIGTIKRAKGLEFAQVLLADVRLEWLPGAGGRPPADDAEREAWELTRRELYVGMTRARDGLWVGVVG